MRTDFDLTTTFDRFPEAEQDAIVGQIGEEAPAAPQDNGAGTSISSIAALGDRYWQGIAPAFETTDAVEATTTTYAMEVGQSFYGRIESSSDEDWVAIQLVAGQTYNFRLLGMGSSFLSDPFLRLMDSAGVQVAFDDDGFTSSSSTHEVDSRLVFTAGSTGTFYLQADAYSSEIGNYLLSATVQNPAGMVFTADEIAWQLLNNGWQYFGAGQAAAFNVGIDNSLTVNITALTEEGQFLAREALNAWSAVTNITFVETTGTAEITFDDNQTGAFANPTRTAGVITSSIVNVGTDWLTEFGTTLNSYGFETYIHEVGHALGLAHGGNYNGSATYGPDNYYLNDGLAWSIMSYMQADNDEFSAGSSGWNTFLDASFRYMMTPMIADIIAIQYLYGASSEFTGNTTWGFNANTGVVAIDTAVANGALMAMTIYDTGGTDTLDLSQTSAAQVISLAAESMSSVLGGRHNLSIARGVVIENAIGGSGIDTITGNAANNTLTGLGGNDVIDGGAGADRMVGGLGDDTFYVDTLGDLAVEAKGQGADRVFSSITYNLSGQHIETLTLTGTANINATGNSLTNTLTGNAGNNLLDGGTGTDSLYGGLGDDTFVINSAGDKAYELKDQGTDIVLSSVSYSLGGQYIENLTLTGSDLIDGTGNTFDNIITGNGRTNRLSGGSGADTLNGAAGADFLTGGAGADTLIGGSGIDTFIWSTVSESTVAASDRITDLQNADFIDLSLIDANSGLTGNQAFVVVGAFTNQAGQLRMAYDAGLNQTSLLADINGDGTADLRVLIDGNHAAFSHFIL